METKHTPGNWAIGKSDSVVVSDRIPDDYSLNGGHDDTEYYGGFCICESISKKADAKLIAAAPDLLEALNEAVKTIRLWHGFAEAVPTEAKAWEYYLQSPEMKKINAAINKATE